MRRPRWKSAMAREHSCVCIEGGRGPRDRMAVTRVLWPVAQPYRVLYFRAPARPTRSKPGDKVEENVRLRRDVSGDENDTFAYFRIRTPARELAA